MHRRHHSRARANVDIISAINWAINSHVSDASDRIQPTAAPAAPVANCWLTSEAKFVCEVARQFMQLRWQTEWVLLLPNLQLYRRVVYPPELEHLWLDLNHRASFDAKFIRRIALHVHNERSLLPTIGVAYVPRPGGTRCLSVGVWHSKPNRYQRLAYLTFALNNELIVDWEEEACKSIYLPFRDSCGNTQFAECSLPLSAEQLVRVLECSAQIAMVHGPAVASYVLGSMQTRLVEILATCRRAEWLFPEQHELLRFVDSSMGA
jgi:hypothetical protein